MRPNPSTGVITGAVYGSDQISCGGINSTQWLVTEFKSSGQLSAELTRKSPTEPDFHRARWFPPSLAIQNFRSLICWINFALAHRACTALRAASLRCLSERFAARAFPPIFPPIRPILTKNSLTSSGNFCLAMPCTLRDPVTKVKVGRSIRTKDSISFLDVLMGVTYKCT